MPKASLSGHEKAHPTAFGFLNMTAFQYSLSFKYHLWHSSHKLCIETRETGI